MERDMLSVRGGAFNIDVWEAGSGEPLLYLHGWPGLQPDAFLDGLAADHHVIAPLHPGYGRSTGDEHLQDLQDLVFYYLDFLDAKGLRNIPLVGHSLGAMFAAELAAVQPERFSKLVLIAPFGLFNSDYPVVDFFVSSPDELKAAMWADPSSEAARAVTQVPQTEGDVAVLLERVKSLRVAAKYLWPIPNRGLTKRIHRVTTPTLLLWGDADGIIPQAYGRDFVKLLPNARLEVIANAGHLPQSEQPEEALRLVSTFLES
ncbi:MAG: alpha/beta fold hydrolase [Dehalococcoidia bacterium]|nr:alpha/beta fold hydrolase [Dehalococcoidia bacterium]